MPDMRRSWSNFSNSEGVVISVVASASLRTIRIVSTQSIPSSTRFEFSMKTETCEHSLSANFSSERAKAPTPPPRACLFTTCSTADTEPSGAKTGKQSIDLTPAAAATDTAAAPSAPRKSGCVATSPTLTPAPERTT